MVKRLFIFACVFALLACSSDDDLDNSRSQICPVSTEYSELVEFVTSNQYWSGPLDFTDNYYYGSGAHGTTLTFKTNPLKPTSLIVTDVKNDKTATWEYEGLVDVEGKTCVLLSCDGLTMWAEYLSNYTDSEGDRIYQFQLAKKRTDGRTLHVVVNALPSLEK